MLSGTGDSSPGANRQERQTDNSLLVRRAELYSHVPYAFMVCTGKICLLTLPFMYRINVTYRYIYSYSCIHTYIRVNIYVHTHIRTYIQTYIHSYTHAYIGGYIDLYIQTYIRIRIRTYLPTYIHTYIHKTTPHRSHNRVLSILMT